MLLFHNSGAENNIAGQVRLTIHQNEEKKFILIPLPIFEHILDCCGSYIVHFKIDKSRIGAEGRSLLMTLLEPLIGENIPYGELVNSVQCYLSSKRYENGKEALKDNAKRYLH